MVASVDSFAAPQKHERQQLGLCPRPM